MSLIAWDPATLTGHEPRITCLKQLEEMFQRAREGYDEGEMEEIHSVLLQHQDVFSKDELNLGLTTLVEHAIDTGEAAPIKQRPWQVPSAFTREDKEAIEKLVAQGSIHFALGISSGLVLVRKRDGSVRPCVDDLVVNAVTGKDAFPLPRTEDCLDAMAGANIFSTMDITLAYNQIPVRSEDIPKRAFVSWVAWVA